MKNKVLILSAFAIRIIALLTMTIDHIGAFGGYFGVLPMSVVYPLRIIGRIAFPLFVFFSVHGAIKTTNLGRYLLRLGGLAIIMMIPEIVLYAVGINDYVGGNIFLALITGVLFVAFFEKPSWKRLYFLLPALLTLAIEIISYFGLFAVPFFLIPMYGFYGFTLFIGVYLAIVFMRLFAKQMSANLGIDVEGFKLTPAYQGYENILVSIMILIINLVWYIVIALGLRDIINQALQTYAILALIPVLFYNGQRGYNAKWWRISNYLYYPVHMGIILVIMYLISL